MEKMKCRDGVRARPGMYIGDVHKASGANHMVLELLANVIDQFLSGNATRCDIELQDYHLTISDDGPGLPFDVQADHGTISQIEYNLENPHFGPTAQGHSPHVHLVFKGVGLAVVNILCSKFTVVSRNGQHSWSHVYEQGLPVGQPTKAEDKGNSGTRLVLHLDQEIFQCPPDPSAIRLLLQEQSHLFPGLKIVFDGSTFFHQRGLISLAENLCQGDVQPAFWHRKKHADFWIDLALAGSGTTPQVTRSWVNGVLTKDGGTHQNALERALEQTGWAPEVSLLNLVMLRPEFAGPTKDKLIALSLEGPLEKAFIKALTADPA